jgi:outer membrane lipoprotein-sorting protein
MKRIFPFILGMLFFSSAFAQYDPVALDILNGMSDKFQKLNSFKAEITYSMINEAEGIDEKFEGEIYVMGNKYRLKTDEQEIINNGETVWTYLPDVNEVNIDNFSDEGDITPSSIYTMYKEGFKYVHIENSTVAGVKCDVVELEPEERDTQFYKIRMEIGSADKMLKRWTMFDKAGNQYIYSIESFDSNLSMSDSDFVFDESKYGNVEVVDLR